MAINNRNEYINTCRDSDCPYYDLSEDYCGKLYGECWLIEEED